MLSTVVLPAPFGPITLVTRPGSAREADVGRGLDAAERDADAAHVERQRAVAGGCRNAATSKSARSRRACSVRRTEARQRARARPPARATARPAAARRRTAGGIRRDRDSSSGSTTLIAAPTTGPNTQPAPPTITASRNRIDCENGNESGATNINSGAKIAAGEPGEHRRQRERRGLDDDRIEADRARRDLGVAHRHHRLAPARCRRAGERDRARRRRAGRRASPSRARRIHCRPIAGGARPIRPLAPPVRPRHSIVPCWTMKANAMVTIAR